MGNDLDIAPQPAGDEARQDLAAVHAEIAPGDWRRALLGMAFAAAAYPAFAVLDWLVYRDRFATLVTIRLIVTAVILACLVALFFTRRYYPVQALACVVGLFCGGGIALMTHLTEGHLSPYYAGLCLVFVCLVAFTTTPPWLGGAMMAVVLLTYYAPMPLLTAKFNWPVLAGNSFFLLSTAVVALLGTSARYRLAFADARQRLELARLNQRLTVLSVHDALTGLRNRRGLLEKIAELTLLRRRYHTQASVVMMDLDYFKRVNDQFGHAMGDEVLRAVARCILGTIRETDVAYRMGGDEFLIALPNTGAPDALTVARRLEQRLRAVFDDPRWRAAQVGCSMGVLGLADDAGAPTTAADFLEKVDRLLYRAKQQAKGTIVALTG
jgi:diguanylate cyclase (GGDEF)-like protein